MLFAARMTSWGATGNFVSTCDQGKLTYLTLPHIPPSSQPVATWWNLQQKNSNYPRIYHLQLSKSLYLISSKLALWSCSFNSLMTTEWQSLKDRMLKKRCHHHSQTQTKWPLVHTTSPSYLSSQLFLSVDRTSIELANYHHASLGIPANSTLLQAICLGHLVTFPGLITKLISRHLLPSIATDLRHQDKNPHSTKKPLRPAPTIHHDDHDLAL